jgi:hypothetical protein
MTFSITPNILSGMTSVHLERLRLLQEAQISLGMDPRNDSQLTLKFMRGEVEEDEHQVARWLFNADRIHKETSYSSILEESMREIASILKRDTGIPWKVVWDIVRFYAPPMLRLYCVRKAGISM